MNKKYLIFVYLFISFFLFADDDFITAKVAADNLNVRVQPSLAQTVVAKFAKGDQVKVFSLRDGWCEVEVPVDGNVWIAASDISEDGTVLKDSPLRSGADITFSPYSRGAIKGEKLNVIERREHWIKVSAPEGLTAWVARKFLDISEEDMKKLSEKIKPAEDKGDAAQ